MPRLRFSPRAVFDFSELVFPNREPTFQTRICNGVLNVDAAAIIVAQSDEKAQLLAILQYANRKTRIEEVIQYCRTWSPVLSADIDAFLAKLGSTTDQVIPGPAAFFDRVELRENLDAVLDPGCEVRILAIKGPSPSGTSYSLKLIGRVGKSLAGANIQEIQLDDYASDNTLEPVDLMESISRLLFIPQDGMPKSKRAQDSRIVIKLVEWFVGAFNNRRDADKPVWLCLDGFHIDGCPQWAVDFAINLACACAGGSVDNLVLILIGFDAAKLPSRCQDARRYEDVTPYTPDHVWEFVQIYAKSLKLPPLDANLKNDIIAGIFKDIPPRPDHTQMRMVAQRAIKVIDEIKRRASPAGGA
jgi:hypothetical protein